MTARPETAPAAQDVRDRLRSLDLVWTRPPEYGVYSLASACDRIGDIRDTLQAVGDVDPRELDDVYHRTMEFFQKSFGSYQRGKSILEGDIERAFVVPMRIERGSDSNSSEVLPFAPILNPKYGIDADIRQRAVVGLPPSVLEHYAESSDPKRRGAIVLAPFFTDMRHDLVSSRAFGVKQYQQWRLGNLANRMINDTAGFAHDVLGAKVIGLGATIPAFTQFGRAIKHPDVITTTGHGGTVHLIVETTRQALEGQDGSQPDSIGVIGGAGSIGYASIDILREEFRNSQMHVYDKNQAKLSGLLQQRDDAENISHMDSIYSTLAESSVIVTAVTTPIDLDREDPYHQLDLTGKVIIDDSQPGSFDKDQVMARGGRLVWVVGQDDSHDWFVTRSGYYQDGGYNFGDEAGLIESRKIWGCEAETAVIAASGKHELAIRARVSPAMARSVGLLLREHGIGVSDAPQSFGDAA